MKLFGPFQCISFAEALLKGRLPTLTPLENTGLLIAEGKIVEVGEFAALEKRADEVIRFSKKLVCLPGFVDAHTHLCFAGSRAEEYVQKLSGATYLEIAKSGGGILSTVRATREASEEELAERTVQRLREKMEQGVTTCEIKSGYGLSVDEECKMLRAIQKAGNTLPIDAIPTCLAAHTLPPEAESEEAYLTLLIEELFPKLKKEALTNRIDIFVEKGAFSISGARRYLNAAKERGFQTTVHANQFSYGGLALAHEVGALSADHLEECDEEQAELLAESATVATVLPGASLGLGIPFAPASKLIDAGCCLAIASDHNPGSAPNGDLLMQAALLGMYEKLSAAETLAGITYRAAAALGLSDRGRLAAGERADFLLFDADSYEEILWRQGGLKPTERYILGERV